MIRKISQAVGASAVRIALLTLILIAARTVFRAMAETPAPAISTKPYVVTNSQAFPNLPLSSRSLVFRNGLLQGAGIDYDVQPGSTFRFRPGVLDDGDRVAVVTFP